MRRRKLDPFPTPRVDPTVHQAAAWKNQSVCAVEVEDGQFQVAVQWSSRDALPILTDIILTDIVDRAHAHCRGQSGIQPRERGHNWYGRNNVPR
jgi:hypothetical protein